MRVYCWERSGRSSKQQRSARFLIIREGIKAQYGSGIRNLLPMIRWQISLFVWLLRNRKAYDIIHACDFDTIIPGLLIKFFFHKVLIYDIFDSYADNLRHTPRCIIRFIRCFDQRLIQKADHIIVVDERRLEELSGIPHPPVSIIQNSPMDIREQIPPSSSLSKKSYLRLAYTGQLIQGRSLLEIIEIVKRHPLWLLELAGFGADENMIIEKIEEAANIHFHGPVAYTHALQISAQADVLFAIYDPSIPNHRLSSPNKVFEAMMLAKPVVVARGTAIDELVEQERFGMVVDYANEQQLEETLQFLADDPDARFKMGRRGRQLYDTRYNWSIMQERLLALYRKIQKTIFSQGEL